MWILWETFISQRFLPSTFSRVFSSKMRYPPNSQIMKAHFVFFTRKLFKRENQLTWFSQLNENTQLVWGRSAFPAHCVMKLSLFYVVMRVNLYSSRCSTMQWTFLRIKWLQEESAIVSMSCMWRHDDVFKQFSLRQIKKIDPKTTIANH